MPGQWTLGPSSRLARLDPTAGAGLLYLVALALCEFDAQCALLLNRRSLGAASPEDKDPGDTGRELTLALLLRL